MIKYFEEEERTSQLQIWALLVFLVFYAIMSAFLEHKTLPVHRSAVATVVGIIFGLILQLKDQQSYNTLTRDAEVIIFLVLYPPMVFMEGYNFKKGAFLKNLKYSVVYGILGTFVFYAITAGLLQVASQLDLLRDAKDINNIRYLSIWEIMLLSACLCGMDAIAGEEVAEHEKFPKLNSIIKGEQIFKDCVTIVLFRSIISLQKEETDKQFIFYWYTPFKIMGNFAILIIGSTLLGALFGFMATYMFKKWRFLAKDKGVTETVVLFLLGFVLYVLSQMIDLSGVISILALGLILNRYNVYNLSDEGRISSTNTFIFVSNICEGLLFLLMGAMIWQTQWENDKASQMSHSWSFIMITVLIIIFARFINIYFFTLISKLISNRFVIHKNELFSLFITGLPKGATTFALFASVSLYSEHSEYAKNEGLVIKSTIIMVVILSCIFLNSLMELILKRHLKKISTQQIKNYLIENTDSLGQSQEQIKQKFVDRIEERIQENVGKAKSRFRKFDDHKIKPFFIYKFEERKSLIENEKIERIRKSQQRMFQALGQHFHAIKSTQKLEQVEDKQSKQSIQSSIQ